MPMTAPDLTALTPVQLRVLPSQLLSRVAEQDQRIQDQGQTIRDQGQAIQSQDETIQKQDQSIKYKEQVNQKLTYELALLKRHRFGQRSENLSALQISLLEEIIDTDIASIDTELDDALEPESKATKKHQAKRKALPPELPRHDIHHDPDATQCHCGCQMKRIGEDVSEKLDYVPGVFSVERHIRGKWVCGECETLAQAAMPAHIIDKGIPTTGLLAHLLISKYADHLPLYRQEQIFARSCVQLSRSTLAEWIGVCGVRLQPLVDAMREHLLKETVLHADETPVPMLTPGKKKTHKAYIWAYASAPFSGLNAVVYDFQPGRSGQHARDFLGDWKGQLVSDDYAGYKKSFDKGVTEIGCMAHARRKFVELHVAGRSQIAGEAVRLIRELYRVEQEVRELDADGRHQIRQAQAKPIADKLH